MTTYPTCSFQECPERAAWRFNQTQAGEWGTWGQQYGCLHHAWVMRETRHREGEWAMSPVDDYALHLIHVKRDGGDCDEDQSAWIKRYFDFHASDEAGRRLASRYPVEYSEWVAECEAGDRTFGVVVGPGGERDSAAMSIAANRARKRAKLHAENPERWPS